MTRWQSGIDGIIHVTNEPMHSLDEFFKPKNYNPKTEEEKQVFEEFSLITSSMAILIHVAESDNNLSNEEKKQIIDDITYQLEQRPFEYNKLIEKFGKHEKEMVLNIYNKILKDYELNNLNLDKIVDDICLIYQNNPKKRYYLIRLCYHCALADHKIDSAEKDAIQHLAHKMHVPSDELKRIEEEAKLDLKHK